MLNNWSNVIKNQLFFNEKKYNLLANFSFHYICIMQTVKRIFDFYIFSNIHVAFAVFSLTKITLLTYKIESNLLPWFVFFSTIASYNFIRLYKIYKIKRWVFKFIIDHKKRILVLTIISALLVIYLSLSLKRDALLALLPFALFTLFYVVPIPVKKNNALALRSVAFLKLFLIAISWAGVTVLVPLINYEIELQSAEIIIFVQRFLFIVVITIPFDIRDMNFDEPGLKTLPQVFGTQRSKVFGLFLLMVFIGLEFLKMLNEEAQFRTHLIIAICALYFLFRATSNQNKYYSAFLVESLPIIWLLLLFVF